ncbi:MAG: hypothetical protein JNJ50_02490 [Acidobacteria bacterium]|nr:hypothetical protein [Acidobacteriota bacterium]
MSVKFDIADWRFELTWRELSCTPLEQSDVKKAQKQNNQRQSASVNQQRNPQRSAVLKRAAIQTREVLK